MATLSRPGELLQHPFVQPEPVGRTQLRPGPYVNVGAVLRSAQRVLGERQMKKSRVQAAPCFDISPFF
jgi:hypothetical protein